MCRPREDPARQRDEFRNRRAQAHIADRSRNASTTRLITPSQSPGVSWMKRRADGYHGESVRPRSHRQQVSKRDKIQTGLFSAPARWAVEVSTAITRSRHSIMAAVSPKSDTSPIGSRGRIAGGMLSSCGRVIAPSCRLTNVMSGTVRSGKKACALSERRRSTAFAPGIPGLGSPAQTRPTLKPPVGKRRCQAGARRHDEHR